MLLFDVSYCLRCSGDEMLLCLGEYSKESSLLASSGQKELANFLMTH